MSVTPAPYTPATLARIRAGATASELGWPADQYNRICERHGIEKRPDVLVMEKRLGRSIIGQVSYNPSTGIIHRGYNDVLLSIAREKIAFEHLFALASSGDETFVTRAKLIEIGGNCSEQTMRKVMYRLGDRLGKVKCRVQASFGPHGGYRLVVEP
jgi:hypothetical protein